MGRRQSRSVDDEGMVKRSPHLAEWAPSSPRRPPTHGVRCEYEGRFAHVAFAQLFAAKKAVDFLIGEEEFKWEDHRTIVTTSGKKITSDHLEEIMEYDYSKQEQEWDFPPSDTKYALMRVLAPQKTKEEIAERNQRLGVEGASAPRAPKERREKVKRPSREGLTSVADICEELGLDASDARAILRKAKIEKPAAGWAGDEAWAAEIKKVIEKGMKK